MNFYEGLIKYVAPIVRWLYRVEVVGMENIPEHGVLMAANHTAFSDVIVISASLRRQVKYMAKKELFSTPIAPVIKALGAIPVDRGGADVRAIKQAIAEVERGEYVALFPQGHRRGKIDPRTTEIKNGIGMIAYHGKADVLPVFIDNKRLKTGMFRKNRILVGKPIPYAELGFESGGKEEYNRVSRLIFDEVCALKYGKADPSDTADVGGGAKDGGR